MTLPNFTLPVVLKLSFQTSQQKTEARPEKNGPRDIQNQHIHLTYQRKSMQVFPVFKSQFQVRVLFNEKNMWCKFKKVYLSPEIVKSVVTFHPPKTKRCRWLFRHPFFFGAAGSMAP